MAKSLDYNDLTQTKITKKQQSVLHIAKSQLGLDDGNYRSVLRLYGGVETSKDMTLEGFRRVIQYLEQIGFKNTMRGKVYQSRRKAPDSDPGGLPHPAQLNKINELFLGIEIVEAERQRGFCKRVIKKVWPQTRDEASKIIEGLKAMLARKEKSL